MEWNHSRGLCQSSDHEPSHVCLGRDCDRVRQSLSLKKRISSVSPYLKECALKTLRRKESTLSRSDGRVVRVSEPADLGISNAL
jgi:hypothetical protein